MASPTVSQSKYHILLVGVDDYVDRPLGGCVNDIDAVQQLLLGARMGIARDQIRRLASPRAGKVHATEIAERPATLDNVRAALAELGSDRVSPTDRVFIYYAGHGTRVECTAPGGRRFHREALVPADGGRPGIDRLLYDFEINAVLRAIAARTRSITLVLDCCHAAGVTREGGDASTQVSRFLELPAGVTRSTPLADSDADVPGGGSGLQRLAAGIDECLVVSACLGHERAQEERGQDGVCHGLFTRAFLTALEAATDVELHTMTWGRIWQATCAGVRHRNSGQHPTMTGSAARAVFAGPPADGDPGIPVSRSGDRYELAAGTLASITLDAELAVYGERPTYFPRLGCEEDRHARIGLLRVIKTTRASAIAIAAGAPFDLPPAARARLVRAGAAARLRCQVLPSSAALEAQLAASPLLELVPPPGVPEVRLEYRDGRWFITDSVHGVGTDGPILFALQPAELDCARDVLEHYYVYSRPLHVAALATDLPGALEVRTLSCPERELSAREAQAAMLPEAPSRGDHAYELRSGARVCFQVRNHARHRLRVTLLNSAASGRVQLLGDEIIEAGADHLFWAHGAIGSPFQMSPPPGSNRCVDRLVAIGSTAMTHELGHLRVDQTFAQVIQRSRSAGRIFGQGTHDAPPLERWTAALAIIETRRA